MPPPTTSIELAGETELGVGTTVTGAALVLHDGEPYFAIFNIGDSRVYRFERNELAQVTGTTPWCRRWSTRARSRAADAEQHPDSNIITRAVGFGAPSGPDYWMLPPRPGLRLLSAPTASPRRCRTTASACTSPPA